LPDYTLACIDVPISRAASDPQYFARLAAGVSAIDKSLGKSASTGTPFVLKARNVPASESAAHEDQVLTTVCASVSPDSAVSPMEPAQTGAIAVPANNAQPATGCGGVSTAVQMPITDPVRRVVQTGEVVFALQCTIDQADKCQEKVHESLINRLNASLSTTALAQGVPNLFWRSAGSRVEATNTNQLGETLVANDERQITTAPDVTPTGDVVTAASLCKPIDQQALRPLIKKQPSWFDVIRQPTDKWVVTAISLPTEIVSALSQ